MNPGMPPPNPVEPPTENAHPMTLTEYCSVEVFPRTTQAGISPSAQMLLDATNYDELMEAEASGALLTPEEQAIAQELKAKNAIRPEVEKELIPDQEFPLGTPLAGSTPPPRPDPGIR